MPRAVLGLRSSRFSPTPLQPVISTAYGAFQTVRCDQGPAR